MLCADEFVLQFRHLLFRAVEHAAEIVPDPLIDIPAGYAGQLLERAAQLLLERLRRHAHLLEQRPGDAFGLVEQREEEMLVRDLLLIELRGDILRGLDRLLHFLRELVDAHGFNLWNAVRLAIRRNLFRCRRPRIVSAVFNRQGRGAPVWFFLQARSFMQGIPRLRPV